MLTEALVALVIIAVGLASLFSTVRTGVHATAIADQERVATIAAQSLLEELGRSQPLVDGVREGDFADGQHWRVNIEPLAADNTTQHQALEGHLVLVTVTWAREGHSRNLRFRTLRLRPAP